MALNNLNNVFDQEINDLIQKGTAKGKEEIIVDVKKSDGTKGPRYFLKNRGDQEFLRMNSNSYLGMSLEEEIIKAEEKASRTYGVGPGAVRFINGTFKAHRDLEKRLALFHHRQDGMIFSAAYASMIGVFAAMTSADTIIVSDELNHNCIINAIRLSRPKDKMIYKHLDMKQLEERLKECIGKGKRLLIVTDGIFSMRGDYAPLAKICQLANKYDQYFPENIIVMVDDSHGVGAFGKTGRGTDEYTGADGVDILIGTLGKAFGVNGGYVVSSEPVIRYLREKAVTYIYSNPITVGEAAAALAVLDYIDTKEGQKRLQYLGQLTKRFENGLKKLGYEIIESPHPIVPLMIRDTAKTTELVKYMFAHGILSTGLNFPVVPKGDETIRMQVNASHTEYDIDYVLSVLEKFKNKRD